MPLSQPPRDDDGRVIPHDHDEIEVQDAVVRGVSEEHVVSDGQGGVRVSSAFISGSSLDRDPTGGMSVDVSKLLAEDNVDVQKRFQNDRFIGAVQLPVEQLRNEQQKVGYDPLSENKYHGGVWGDLKRPGARKKRILKSGTVVCGDVAIA